LKNKANEVFLSAILLYYKGVRCKWRAFSRTKAKNMRLLTTIFLSLSFLRLLADEPRFSNKFLSANKKYAFVLTERKKDSTLFNGKYYPVNVEFKWSVMNTSSKKILYEIETTAGQKSVSVSNDGQFVVIINDWPVGSPRDTLEMVTIFNKGQLLKKIRLNELIVNTFNVSKSVSHFSWTLDYPIVAFNSDEIKFTTFELNDFKIKISSGETCKSKNSIISDSSVFVYGEIISKNADIFEMKVCQKAFGPLKNDTIQFQSKKSFEKNRYYSVLIDNGQELTIIYKNVDINRILLNSCILVLD
jgi:hypothetical protein